jgi:sulfite reductase (NADPH) flavoprotein alpha-component
MVQSDLPTSTTDNPPAKPEVKPNPKATPYKTEPESSLPPKPDPTTDNDPTISNGPTMVDVSGPHGPTPDFRIAKGAQVGNADYFETLIAQSSVSLKTKQGDSVAASALDIVELLSVQNSSSVWVFDDAKAIGFGSKALKWGEDVQNTEVVELQTRAGAGSGLAGYLANKVFVEQETGTGIKTVTVLATVATLPLLLPVLSALPSTESSKIVIHLATTTTCPDTLQFTNSLSALIPLLPSIPADKFSILFSSSPSDIVHTTASAYSPHHGKNVINVIESTFAGRQINDLVIPRLPTVHLAPTFTPYGPVSSASSIFLVPASHLANIITSSELVKENGSSAVIVLHSWDNVTGLSKIVSGGKKKLYLINESEESQSILKENVLSALYDPLGSPSKHVFPCIRSIVVPSGSDVFETIKTAVPAVAAKKADEEVKTITFFTNQTEPLPELLAQLFMASPTLATALDKFGSSVAQGVKSVLTLRPASKDMTGPVTPVIAQGEESDVVWITEPQIIKQNNVFDGLKRNGLLVLVVPWSEEEVGSKLSRSERETIKSKNVRVFLLPPSNDPIVQEVAFLMMYTSAKKISESVKKVLNAYYDGNVSREAIEEAQANLTEVAGVSEWKTEAEEGDKEEVEKSAWEWDAVAGKDGIVDTNTDGKPLKGDWTLAAKHFLFKEAFEYGAEVDKDEELKEKAILDLKPSLEDQTYLVTVDENRRLTPETYDRNVFHIAFDTKGTGLKYEVGEALGIHGWNDTEEVKEFIKWYGLNEDDLVSVPSPHDNGATYETRTIFQLMQQNLDIFGKPGKSFYASLASLAKNKNEERTLRFIAAPEGVALFKKMSEVETVTFADVLRQFKSARPSIEELVGLVPEIKPRHYSIASSNAAVGDRVELLIVTVDWATPSGTPRYGQCTRYLVGLPVGAKVTVSLKPSVMKLPPLDTQPIIMAGLGTG